MSEKYKGQDYEKLKRQCQEDKTLFTDAAFPPSNPSIFLDLSRTSDIVWKRPKEIVDNPRLFVDGVSVNDVRQGTLGNCWFVSACSALTHHKALLNKVIPNHDEQEWNDKKPEKYAGIFHFQFWRFGNWIEVVVDDLLPTQNGKLIFAKSKTSNEFWSALLEKAFAKLYGCYESLIGGHLADALQDLSGGVPETIDLTDASYVDTAPSTKGTPDARMLLFNHLKEAADHKALIAAAIKPQAESDMEKRLDVGLVVGHAYAVTAVHRIELDDSSSSNNSSLQLLQFFRANPKVHMVRLQNPWGGVEWKGPWADNSVEWNQVSTAQKEELGIVVDEDGEFWMHWNDFCKYFTDVTVCQLINTSFFSFKTRFNETIFKGQWKAAAKKGMPSDRAGGCNNYKASFMQNPQYLLDVREDQLDTVMLALTQQESLEKGKRTRAPYLTIGMHVLQVESNRKYRLHQTTKSVTHSSYANMRSSLLCVRNLRQGRYVLLPTTFAPGEEGEYLLRVYSVGDVDTRELLKDKPSAGCCSCFSCCCKQVCCVTRCRIVEAKSLQRGYGSAEIDPYFIIKSEKEKFQSHHVVKDQNPKFDVETVFYRKYPNKGLEIEFYDSNFLRDTFLGGATIAAPIDNVCKRVEVPLKDKDEILKATVVLELCTYDDVLYI